jgi:hypothetical protein
MPRGPLRLRMETLLRADPLRLSSLPIKTRGEEDLPLVALVVSSSSPEVVVTKTQLCLLVTWVSELMKVPLCNSWAPRQLLAALL